MDRVDIYLHLHRLPVFNGLPSEDLWRWSRDAHHLEYHAGETILLQGKAIDRLYLTLSGDIRIGDVDLDNSVLAAFGRILTPQPASATWTAGEGGCCLLTISRRDAFTALFECPFILRELLPLADLPAWMSR